MVCCVWFLASGGGECCCDAAPAPKGELCTSHRPGGRRAPLLRLPPAEPGPFTRAGLPGVSAPPARGGEAGVGRGSGAGGSGPCPGAAAMRRGLPALRGLLGGGSAGRPLRLPAPRGPEPPAEGSGGGQVRGAGAGRDREAAAAGPGGGPAGLGLREAAPARSERGVRRAGAAAARWEPAAQLLSLGARRAKLDAAMPLKY